MCIRDRSNGGASNSHLEHSIARATPSTTSLEPLLTKASSPGADQQVGGGPVVHGCRCRAVSGCPLSPARDPLATMAPSGQDTSLAHRLPLDMRCTMGHAC